MRKIEIGREKMDRLKEDCRQLMEQEAEGCDTRTLLKDMYCGYFCDKTEDIGYVMADRVIGLVNEYGQEMADAMENPDGWYEEKLQKILEGKHSCVSRCNTLYKVRIGMLASGISAEKGPEAAEEYINQHAQKAFTSEEATEELEAKLKKELKDVIESNHAFATALNTYAEKAAGAEEDVELAVAKYGEDASRLKALLAMKAYLETGEDGYLKNDLPKGASLKEVTYSICASVDTLGIANAVESGTMGETEAAGIIGTIGKVIGAATALGLSVGLGGLAAAVAGNGFLAAIGGIVIAYAAFRAMKKPFMDAGSELFGIGKEIVCFGAKCILSVGKKVISGIQKLVSHIRGRHQKYAQEEMDSPGFTEPAQEGDLEMEDEGIQAQAFV